MSIYFRFDFCSISVRRKSFTIGSKYIIKENTLLEDRVLGAEDTDDRGWQYNREIFRKRTQEILGLRQQLLSAAES
jgi:hypothetical protein